MMAKSVAEALRRQEEAARRAPPKPEPGPLAGFTRTFTAEELERIEIERAAMRERLLAPG
jgi:hypothetical protein